jgi:hypothetical protein
MVEKMVKKPKRGLTISRIGYLVGVGTLFEGEGSL